MADDETLKTVAKRRKINEVGCDTIYQVARQEDSRYEGRKIAGRKAGR